MMKTTTTKQFPAFPAPPKKKKVGSITAWPGTNDDDDLGLKILLNVSVVANPKKNIGYIDDLHDGRHFFRLLVG